MDNTTKRGNVSRLVRTLEVWRNGPQETIKNLVFEKLCLRYIVKTKSA